MTPRSIVLAFTRMLIECVAAIQREFEGARRVAPDAALMLFPRDGGPGVRVGYLEGIGEFELHGVGCRVEYDSGAVVDFDWDVNGREVFDGWRLLQFAKSRGEYGFAEADLVTAARSSAVLVEIKPGWFAATENLGDG